MTAIATAWRAGSRTAAVLGVLALGGALSGCAGVGDTMSSAFADPAKYELYDCKQLEPERRRLATALAENQGLMAKAETGVGGSVVAEMAYRNENIALRGQMHFAEDAWRKNRCRESAPATPAGPPPAPLPPPSRAGSAVY
jgi:hypothetical protein